MIFKVDGPVYMENWPGNLMSFSEGKANWMLMEKITEGVPPNSSRVRGHCIIEEHFLPLKDHVSPWWADWMDLTEDVRSSGLAEVETGFPVKIWEKS